MARQAAGLSLGELSARSGLSKGYLSRLESAHPAAANPSRATLAALARALPSTLPLIQNLDPDAGLPSPKALLRAYQEAPVHPTPRPGAAAVASPDSETLLSERGLEGLPASWEEWEIILALTILESSGLGSPTLAVLMRACNTETLSSKALLQLENAGLVQRIPPARPGEAVRYTQGPKKLDEFGIKRPADFFMRAAIRLLLHTGKHEHE
jgi:transcriptional regulator with XRE-family HTH domain